VHEDVRRVTLREASMELGVSEGAIRKRVARGTIRSELGEDGRRYVYVPAGADSGADSGADASSPHESGALKSGEAVEDPLYGEMRERIASLERQLEQANERDRENRRIIAALTSRIPELEAPQEASEPPHDADEPQGGGQPRPAAPGAQEGARRPWWRRVFGG
jgi:hypothetical protein